MGNSLPGKFKPANNEKEARVVQSTIDCAKDHFKNARVPCLSTIPSEDLVYFFRDITLPFSEDQLLGVLPMVTGGHAFPSLRCGWFDQDSDAFVNQTAKVPRKVPEHHVAFFCLTIGEMCFIPRARAGSLEVLKNSLDWTHSAQLVEVVCYFEDCFLKNILNHLPNDIYSLSSLKNMSWLNILSLYIHQEENVEIMKQKCENIKSELQCIPVYTDNAIYIVVIPYQSRVSRVGRSLEKGIQDALTRPQWKWDKQNDSYQDVCRRLFALLNFPFSKASPIVPQKRKHLENTCEPAEDDTTMEDSFEEHLQAHGLTPAGVGLWQHGLSDDGNSIPFDFESQLTHFAKKESESLEKDHQLVEGSSTLF
jgi:hypothetical protein